MTTSRIVRGTKGRVFLYLIGAVFFIGIFACYNNTVLTQLDDIKKTSEVCHQENENLNTQIQMISDYKRRLEDTMRTQKAEHQQKLEEIETRYHADKQADERTMEDMKTQLETMKKHYNLLQTQLDDEKKEHADVQHELQMEIDNLHTSLSEQMEKVKKLQADKEELKSMYLNIQNEKVEILNRAKGVESNKFQSENEINHLTSENMQLKEELSELKAQLESKNRGLEIPVNPQPSNNISKHQPNDGVADEPPANNDDQNFIIAPAEQPNLSSSTKSSVVSRASLDVVQPLKQPSASPDGAKVSAEMHNEVEGILPMPVNRIPDGVVQPPEQQQRKGDDGVNKDIISEGLPNRYRNNIIDNEKENEANAERSEREMKLRSEVKEENEKENGAREVFDEKVKNERGEGVGENPNGKGGEEGAGDYGKDAGNDVQLEQDDQDEDEDDPDYMNHPGRKHKDLAVRN